ncbi:MAG: helix-turn-helix domain-containing protein [Chloroflexota bacterium]|nr:helix-turn-helix domain-containing protein [Chloroflexota bacterium]
MEEQIRTFVQWRKLRLMTYRELAAKAKVGTETIRQIERAGEITEPRQTIRPGTIRRLSDALDVKPEQVAEFRHAMGIDDEER